MNGILKYFLTSANIYINRFQQLESKMSRYSKEKYSTNRQRNHSPQYNRSSWRRDASFSQADTNEDDCRSERSYRRSQDNRDYKQHRPRPIEKHPFSRESPRQSKVSYENSQKVKSSNEYSINESRDLDRSKICVQREERSKMDVSRTEKERPRTKSLTEIEVNCIVIKIISQIQRMGYQNSQSSKLSDNFKNFVQKHIKFVSFYPKALNKVGQELLKDGLFHEMWKKILLKKRLPSEQSVFQNYYAMFIPFITKNLTSFEQSFNPIPGQEDKSNHDATFKRYRMTCEQSTRSTTKADCMILFEQVKSEIKAAQIQENMVKKLEQSIQEFKFRKNDNELNLDVDPKLEDWFDDGKTRRNISKQEEEQRRKQEIKNIKSFRNRSKSPLSQRFRMMHEIQSNQRRLKCEMACVFLKIDKFFLMSDLHIVRIDETIFSQNQEIVVLKAYCVEFCPEMNKMKIEPKLRNLISVYKFSGLQELIRLQKTHGKFDGIIVYPESFNIKKYLTQSDQMSLLSDQHLKQVKEQLEQQSQEEQANDY